MTMLEQLRRTHRNRNVASVVLVVVTLVAVVAGVVLVGSGALSGHGKGSVPAVSTKPTATGANPCSISGVTCLGANRFLVPLTVPVTVTLPANFEGRFTRFSAGVLEDYRNDVDSTGVTVMENAKPVVYNDSWSHDPSAGTTAASMATWLSRRPFLAHATVTRTTVGGRTAWRVSAELKPGAALPAVKGEQMVAPTFTAGSGESGYGSSLPGDFTLLDVPGAGVTVIWSWTLNNDRQTLVGNQPYVDGLSFS